MQSKGPPPPPVGIVFDTALNRSEHVLAMALLYRLQAARELRVASLSVSRPDLRTAALCDALARNLSGNGSRNVAPIGVPAKITQGPADAMADAVLGQHPHGIHKINDTADVGALIRNGVSAQQPANGAVVVAGPLTNLVAAMALPDFLPLVSQRVRTLVIPAEDLRSDAAAADRVLAAWPGTIVTVDAPELVFPGAQLEARFAWAEKHPVRDAYQAFQKMPYDAPLQSAVAVLYAARPQSEFFSLSAAENGKRRTLRVAANQKEAVTQAIVDLITAQPQAPAGAGRGKAKE